jgi:hypothetical protein
MNFLSRLAHMRFSRGSGITLHEKPRSEPEPAYAREREMTGFFATLTPEQQERALAHRGAEGLADPEFRGER